jgi:hypothetical protein
MKGWKTLGFGIAVAVAGVLQSFDWATVVPQDKTWSGVVMIAIGAGITALRYVTTSPIGKSN